MKKCQKDISSLQRGYRFAILCITVLCMGCVSAGSAPKLSDAIMGKPAWREVQIPTAVTTLSALIKNNDPTAAWHIYIEGDGMAYLPQGGVSGNPTPRNPVGLKLALADTHPRVLYVARPCQFTVLSEHPECRSGTLYTDKRWSTDIISAYAQALAPYIKESGAGGAALYGYSGGAYIVLGVASRWPAGSIAQITTYAGNLLPNAVQVAHHFPPLDDVSPLDWSILGGISQTHIVAREDKVIPARLRDTYVQQAGTYGAEALAADRWRWDERDGGHGWGE